MTDRPSPAGGAPLRVLMLIQRFHPVFTGMGIQVEGLARALRAEHVEVTVATARAAGAPDADTRGACAVRRFPLPVTRNPVALAWGSRALLRHLGGGGHDVLHVHGAPPVLPLALSRARRHGLPVVVTSTLLGSDDPLSLARRGRLARWRFGAYARADAFVALSEALRATYAPAGIPEARVSVIPAGIPEARTRRPRPDAEAAQRLGWDLHAPRALFVGALLRRKGLDVLLDAWERVLAARPGARLLVAGPDRFPEDPALQAFADAVRARVARPPLAGTVTLLGRVEDAERVADLHGAADVFLFPSRMEGFGIVIAEALAAGTPVVTARIPGITDWNVRDGETGFVVPPEDPAALAERTLALFADPGLRRRLGEAGREDVRRRFTLEAAAAAHRRLYEGLPSSRTG